MSAYSSWKDLGILASALSSQFLSHPVSRSSQLHLIVGVLSQKKNNAVTLIEAAARRITNAAV